MTARVTVREATPAQVHADPRAHMEAIGGENDVEATLRDADEKDAQRERALNDEWHRAHGLGDLEEGVG